jgi:hypothetical protein
MSGTNTTSGGILSFTTPANVVPPTTTTDPATSVTDTTATINGTGTSNGASSTLTFKWGTSPTLTSGTTTATALQSPIAPSSVNAPVFANLSGLTGGTTYYFRITISNSNGSVDGSILQFTTAIPATTTTTTAPTTTVVPTTTVPSSASNAGVGRVTGSVWFDTDLNEKRDAGEPWLAGVSIMVSPKNQSGLTPAQVAQLTFTATTNSSGVFDFTSVSPNTYVIKGSLPTTSGINKSWDTSGNADWLVTVTVVANQTSRGDFAAIGMVTASGCVSGATADSTLNATWAGFDKIAGSADDALFVTDIAQNCDFNLEGLPTGDYKVVAKRSTGRVFASSALELNTNSPTAITSGAIKFNVKIVKELPATGTQMLQTWMMGSFAMLVGGSTISVLGRRRRRTA